MYVDFGGVLRAEGGELVSTLETILRSKDGKGVWTLWCVAPKSPAAPAEAAVNSRRRRRARGLLGADAVPKARLDGDRSVNRSVAVHVRVPPPPLEWWGSAAADHGHGLRCRDIQHIQPGLWKLARGKSRTHECSGVAAAKVPVISTS